MHSPHAQRADLSILDLGQVGLPAIAVHSIVRNLLTAQLDQIFAHEPERDAGHGEFKSGLSMSSGFIHRQPAEKC